jgi:hypothetical protein
MGRLGNSSDRASAALSVGPSGRLIVLLSTSAYQHCLVALLRQKRAQRTMVLTCNLVSTGTCSRRGFGVPAAAAQRQRHQQNRSKHRACCSAAASAAVNSTADALLSVDATPFIGPIQVVKIEGGHAGTAPQHHCCCNCCNSASFRNPAEQTGLLNACTICLYPLSGLDHITREPQADGHCMLGAVIQHQVSLASTHRTPCCVKPHFLCCCCCCVWCHRCGAWCGGDSGCVTWGDAAVLPPPGCGDRWGTHWAHVSVAGGLC